MIYNTQKSKKRNIFTAKSYSTSLNASSSEETNELLRSVDEIIAILKNEGKLQDFYEKGNDKYSVKTVVRKTNRKGHYCCYVIHNDEEIKDDHKLVRDEGLLPIQQSNGGIDEKKWHNFIRDASTKHRNKCEIIDKIGKEDSNSPMKKNIIRLLSVASIAAGVILLQSIGFNTPLLAMLKLV